jgi:hypothetical protein
MPYSLWQCQVVAQCQPRAVDVACRISLAGMYAFAGLFSYILLFLPPPDLPRKKSIVYAAPRTFPLFLPLPKAWSVMTTRPPLFWWEKTDASRTFTCGITHSLILPSLFQQCSTQRLHVCFFPTAQNPPLHRHIRSVDTEPFYRLLFLKYPSSVLKKHGDSSGGMPPLPMIINKYKKYKLYIMMQISHACVNAIRTKDHHQFQPTKRKTIWLS